MLPLFLLGSEDQGAPAQPRGANLNWKKTGKNRNNLPNATRENENHKKTSPNICIRQLVFVDDFKWAYTCLVSY